MCWSTSVVQYFGGKGWWIMSVRETPKPAGPWNSLEKTVQLSRVCESMPVKVFYPSLCGEFLWIFWFSPTCITLLELANYPNVGALWNIFEIHRGFSSYILYCCYSFQVRHGASAVSDHNETTHGGVLSRLHFAQCPNNLECKPLMSSQKNIKSQK